MIGRCGRRVSVPCGRAAVTGDAGSPERASLSSSTESLSCRDQPSPAAPVTSSPYARECRPRPERTGHKPSQPAGNTQIGL